MPPKSGSMLLIGFSRGSVTLYKKFPIKLTRLLVVFTILNATNQLKIACAIKNQIKTSIIWLINIIMEVIKTFYEQKH